MQKKLRKLNNMINEIKNLSKLVKFIVQFNLFCVMKHKNTPIFFSKNASLLEKLKNKILSCTFPIKKNDEL